MRTHFLCFLCTPPVVIFPKHSFINEAPGVSTVGGLIQIFVSVKPLEVEWILKCQKHLQPETWNTLLDFIETNFLVIHVSLYFLNPNVHQTEKSANIRVYIDLLTGTVTWSSHIRRRGLRWIKGNLGGNISRTQTEHLQALNKERKFIKTHNFLKITSGEAHFRCSCSGLQRVLSLWEYSTLWFTGSDSTVLVNF